MKPDIKFDHIGGPLCPLTYTEWEWVEDAGDEMRVPTTYPCESLLHLIATLQFEFDNKELSRVDVTAGGAVCSSWQVECERGHVLVTSYGPEESAEPFDWHAVFGAPE